MKVSNALEEHVKMNEGSNNIFIPTSSPGGCSCPASTEPVFIAPFDLCRYTQYFGSNTSSFCQKYGNLQLPSDHLLVCTTKTQIDYMWRNQSSCHNTTTGLPFLHRGYLACQGLYCLPSNEYDPTATCGYYKNCDNDEGWYNCYYLCYNHIERCECELRNDRFSHKTGRGISQSMECVLS